MDMEETWSQGLQAWAKSNDSVRELWLFGSRAKGTASADSDVDIALALMPPKGNWDWAGGNYLALESDWKQQIEKIVGRHVSLESIYPGTKGDKEVRSTGVMLWYRE
jgi:predicted nucleotidyltransferase